MFIDDRTRVAHMVEACRDAMSFADGRRRSDLDDDRQLALALVKWIEIVGEAAIGVSKGLQAGHPEIPWAAIATMRHRLVHGYFSIDMDRLWDTVQENVPDLLVTLSSIQAGLE